MTESQRKWLLDLQSKGIRFNEYHDDLAMWLENSELLDFTRDLDCYLIPAQPIPDIPDWREVCMEMYDKGIKFEMYNNYTDQWINAVGLFDSSVKRYRIPQQPLPEWREEMTEEKIFSNLRITDAELLEKIDQYMKDNPDSVIPVDEAQIARITELVKDVKIDEETKPDQREEIHHRELQIQWHEDMLHHLMTGEPMSIWEYRLKNGDGEWKVCSDPHFSEKYEYRRKPRTVTYWHCLVEGCGTMGVLYLIESTEDALREHVKSLGYEVVGQITETTVEIED